MLYDAFKVVHNVSQKLVPFCNCFMTNVKWGVSFDEISV